MSTFNRKKILQMVEVGFTEDFISRSYDYINLGAILANLVVSILFTYDNIAGTYSGILTAIEFITVLFFAVDYFLRIFTADLLYPGHRVPTAVFKYVLSFTGIVDLLSFLPYFLPVFFPTGTIAFRMLRVARIFRLFRINAYYDSLNVITEVLTSKKQQLLSSVFIIFILMVASSLSMYSLEHAAQPEVFENAFSGIWWATSTLLTVGYGDIYPITTGGKILGIIISFLGVGMVAIPTGIISAGFVEQYSRLRESANLSSTNPLNFLRVHLQREDPWVGKSITDVYFPRDIIVAAVVRKNEAIAPSGDLVLAEGDTVLLGGKVSPGDYRLDLQEITLTELHPWANQLIMDLELSRHSFIVTVRRGKDTIVPHGDVRLLPKDVVLVYTQKKISEALKVRI